MTVFTVLFLPKTEEPVWQSLVGTGQTRLGEVQRTPGTVEHHGWPEDGLPGIRGTNLKRINSVFLCRQKVIFFKETSVAGENCSFHYLRISFGV